MRLTTRLVTRVFSRAPGLALVCALALAVAPARGVNPLDPDGGFAGSYTGGNLRLDLSANGNQLTGTLAKGDQKFPVTASVVDQHLKGEFTASQDSFPFDATLNGSTLTFVSSGKAYMLSRSDAPATTTPQSNPPPTVPANGTGDALEHYTVINSTPAGRMLQLHIDGASEHDGLIQGLRDLGASLHDRLDLKGYANKQDHFAWASYATQTVKPAMKGVAFCQLDKGGAKLMVIYARADTSAKDMSILIHGMEMKDYAFPDGTGSVGLPEGWTCKSQSYLAGVQVEGPAGQEVRFYDHVNVYTPDNFIVRTQQRLGKPVTSPIAPFSSPVDSINALWRQFAQSRAQNNMPVYELQKINSATDPEPGIYKGGQVAVVDSLWVLHNPDGGARKMHIRARIETHPYDATNWERVNWATLGGPEETFEKDLPVMLAISQSLKVDWQKVMQLNAANTAAQNALAAGQMKLTGLRMKTAEAQQKAAAEVSAARDDYFNGEERNSTIRLRSDTDVDEIVRGERTVLDTNTNETRQVDLFNSHEIVDALNYQQPNRFVEIPLRDQMYPLNEKP